MMEKPTNPETIAMKVETGAEKVGNERTGFISKMARGILDLEVWIARKIREKQSEQPLPEFLDIKPEKQEAFFLQLKTIKESILQKIMSQDDAFVAPEALPQPNLCGITASALTEKFREAGRPARTVYGHHTNQGSVAYHYWTEVTDDNNQVYVVDATYGQFDPNKEEMIIAYPVSQFEQLGLVEFNEGGDSILEWDKDTARVLIENEGVLPIRSGMSDDEKQAYEKLILTL